SSFAAVFSDARSEPAPGSENPWHHQSSMFAARGRKRCFCSSVPNCNNTGPIMVMLNEDNSGAGAIWFSSRKIIFWIAVQPGPSHSFGQDKPAQPLAFRI